MYKNYILLMIALSLALLCAFDTKPGEVRVRTKAAAPCTDGPYIFYHADSLEILYASGVDTLLNLQSRKIAYRDTAGLALTCRTETGRDSFRFGLRPFRVKSGEYKAADRTLAISDIEGNFYAFKRLLQANGVMDGQYRWTFGDGRLALVGDFVDRGRDVTAVLWLIYKLEAEAAAAGGDVRFVLGNHEEMMLRGDARYAQRKYRTLATSRAGTYAALWSADTELGRWLRSKNAVERSGREALFVHGGISQSLVSAQLKIGQINDTIRQYLGVSQRKLNSIGGISAFLFSDYGPMWYRGLVIETPGIPAATRAQVDSAVVAFNVRRIVVGHTLVEKIGLYHGERVAAIDVAHPKEGENREPEALWIEKGKLWATDGQGKRRRL
jgi:Calcineurin-like phosphoesterase